MTNLRQVAQQALEALKSAAIFVDSFRGQKATQEAITALQTELAQPEQEPSQWRDMVVVSLVREGINKHKARELADHFATPLAAAQPEQQAEPCIGKDPRCPCQDGDACHYKDCGNTKARPVPVAQPEQEPVAWLKEDWTGGHLNYACVYERAFAAFPVYKHSPAAQRKPLTDEEIRRIKPVSPDFVDFRSGVRCAEAAHNIKERNT